MSPIDSSFTMNKSVLDWLQQGQFYHYQGKKIFYNQFGNGDDILLIHGYPFSSYEWKKIIPELTTDFRVTVLDLLGFGFSDKPENHVYSFSEYADIVEKLLQYLNISSLHIICHDLSVSVVQELLAKTTIAPAAYRIKSVCFANGNLISDAYKPRLIQRLLSQTPSFIGSFISKKISKETVRNAIFDLYGEFTKPTDEFFDELWSILNYNQGKNISYLLGRLVFEKAKYQKRWIDAMNTSKVPMCYLCGPADPNSGLDMACNFQKIFPKKSVLWMPAHIGHWPMIEDKEAFLSIYLHWLEKQESRKLLTIE